MGAAAQDPPPVVSLEVSPGVHLLRSNTPIGNSSSLVVSGSRGTLLVDPNVLGVEAEMRGFLGGLGPGSLPLFVAASHAHGDHAEGLTWIAGEGTVVASRANAESLARQNVVRGSERLPKSALPTLVFTDSLRLDLGDDLEVMLFAGPRSGHTGGDLFTWVPAASLLYVGDYLFLNRLPIVDVDSGGGLDGYLATIHRLVTALPPETNVYGGHGTFGADPIRTVTLDDWQAWAHRVRAAADVVLDAAAAGATAESIVADGPPADVESLLQRPRFVSWERWVDQVLAERATSHR
jgi:glyoxylase-like metal-dependent hydrolase (beta-lactamase superfamily II)